PVVVAATDVLPSLQSGLLDSFPSTPLAALAMQWFGLAPNMLDVPWAPLQGCTILTEDAWNAIPEQYHEALIESARRNGEETKDEIRRQDRKAIEVMKKYGLVVNEVDEATKQEWIKNAESVYPIVREKMVPSEIFDQTKALVDEYRAKNP
ncbi:MAG: TRAP transporter substrate-binding protein DctP, partial [Proteobacteria bacterium]|nr:TRAP transporter substrate-binding protein DctP [Pseudomonadota bacterium]